MKPTTREWVRKAENDFKVGVLANLCGYRNTNSFCVAFKQAVGMSPKQFREIVVH